MKTESNSIKNVGELIKFLKQFDPKLPVMIWDNEGDNTISLGWIELSKDKTSIIIY